jgi:hypothetical protein
MKKAVCHLLLCLLLGTLTAKAQPPGRTFRTLDLDSMGYEWTALVAEYDNFYVSTIPETDSLNPETGPLRLRTYLSTSWNTPPAQTKHFAGKMRVNNMAYHSDRLYLGGMFTDSSSLDSFSLIPHQVGQKDAFIAAFNTTTQQIVWRWQKAEAGHNYVHQIRYHYSTALANRLVASGITQSNQGWLAILDATTGQVLHEKSFPGIRTMSDAIYDSKVPGSLLLTGTCSDSGYINQQQVPLTPPFTGVRTFLARYYPTNDSIVFLKSAAYDDFDFSPSMSDDDFWSTPSIDTLRPGYKQLLFDNFIPQSAPVDSTQHLGMFSIAKSVESQRPMQVHLTLRLAPPIPLQYEVNIAFLGMPCQLELDHWAPTGPAKMFMHESSSPGLGSSFYLAFPMKQYSLLSYATSLFEENYLAQPQPHQHKWILIYSPPVGGSVANISQIKFSISPNPVSHGSFRLRTQDPFQHALPWLLRDLQGRVVQQGVLPPGEDEIQCGQLPKGMYYFELRSTAGSGVQKVLIH